MAFPRNVVDFRLAGGAIANPDGTVPGTATGCTSVTGPGLGPQGNLTTALRFAGGAHLTASPTATSVDPRWFCVRLVLRVTAPVSGRVNLFESALPGCSLELGPTAGRGQFRVVGLIHNARNGWSGVDTGVRLDLRLDKWFTLDLVCDGDTVAVFVDENLIALTAYPDGAPVPSIRADFVVGVHPDLASFPFTGEMALVQLWQGMPPLLQALLDEARGNPEWLIRLKENTLLPGFGFGARVGDISYDAASRMWLQRFANATIGHAIGLPAAYVMYGAIRERWLHARGLPKLLGPLVSDEGNTRAPHSRRSVFEQGAIYWSEATGAWEILGRPYIDYEQMGGSVSSLGLPIDAVEKIPGGTVQRFRSGRLYFRSGASRAYEVHGTILERYLATGGPNRWGFPVSDEEDVHQAPALNVLSPPPTGAKESRFEWEGTKFLWSRATGAHQVQGSICAAYLAAGGPGVPNDDSFNGLGLPITDEADVPHWSGFGRFNAFQNGSVVYKGNTACVCPAFRIRLGLVQTEEDEGIGQGENDLYFRINLSQNGSTVFAGRIPNRGSFGDDNSCDLDFLIDHLVVPNDPELRLELSVEVWDEDSTSGDEHLGTLSRELHIGNAWGFLLNAQGEFTEANLSKVKLFKWRLQPRQPPNAPKDFWNVTNRGTPTLLDTQYAAAFTDIDDDPEWTDPSDWAQREVFARKVKRSAAGGNCFGMCVEALYAWHGRDMGLPLSRFWEGDWETLRSTINIKHIYWFGSDALAHTQDQKEDKMKARAVFLETQQRFAGGDPCVISMYATSEYGGVGHSVVPFAWENNGPSWIIHCFDPNAQNAPAQIVIDPNQDAFRFDNLNVSLNGSLLFTPWSAINHRQCSPAWDPNLLLLALLLVAVGSDASTDGIEDGLGGNLWMPENTDRERGGGRGQFAPVAALNGHLDGEILVRRVRPELDFMASTGDTLDRRVLEATFLSRDDSDDSAGKPLLVPRRLALALSDAKLTPAIQNLTLRDLLHGTGGASESVDRDAAVAALGNWLRRESTSRGPDFVHQLRGVRQGHFEHTTRWRLTGTTLRSPIARGEVHRLEAGGLSGRMPLYRLTAERDKLVSFEQIVRLGNSAEFARVSLGKLPSRAGLALNVSVRAGLAAVDVLTAGERVDVPVLIETWRGTERRQQRFSATIEGGMRLTPALHETGVGLKLSPIKTMFGEAGAATFLKSI